MTEKEFKIILDKFLNGTITPEEEVLLNHFEEQAMLETKNDLFQTDLEKKTVKNEIFLSIKKEIKPKNIFKISMAASILLLISLGLMWFLKQHNNPEIMMVANNSNQVKEVLLEDGSLVVLNKKSSLKYINNLNGTRHLDLEGEAFFKVKRMIDKPFIVETQGINTKVLGTSFNIANQDSIINVTVATGLVEVSDANHAVLLKPNEQTNYSFATKTFTNKKIHHEISISWFKETIYLDKISMKELSDFLKQRYGVKIKYSNSQLEDIQMSITIMKKDTLESILKKINYITELQLTLKENNMIEIK